MDICYRVPGNSQLLVIEAKPRKQFMRYRQLDGRHKEAGGQLFACIKNGKLHIVVATQPSRFDIRTRFGFKPNRGMERRTINQMYAKGLHFIGDWHTHPEPLAQPSLIDIENIKNIFTQSVHQLGGMLMVIVGTDSALEGMYVGLCNEKGCVQLKCVS